MGHGKVESRILRWGAECSLDGSGAGARGVRVVGCEFVRFRSLLEV